MLSRVDAIGGVAVGYMACSCGDHLAIATPQGQRTALGDRTMLPKSSNAQHFEMMTVRQAPKQSSGRALANKGCVSFQEHLGTNTARASVHGIWQAIGARC